MNRQMIISCKVMLSSFSCPQAVKIHNLHFLNRFTVVPARVSWLMHLTLFFDVYNFLTSDFLCYNLANFTSYYYLIYNLWLIKAGTFKNYINKKGVKGSWNVRITFKMIKMVHLEARIWSKQWKKSPLRNCWIPLLYHFCKIET